MVFSFILFPDPNSVTKGTLGNSGQSLSPIMFLRDLVTEMSHISTNFCVSHTLYFIFLVGQLEIFSGVCKCLDFSTKRTLGLQQRSACSRERQLVLYL